MEKGVGVASVKIQAGFVNALITLAISVCVWFIFWAFQSTPPQEPR